MILIALIVAAGIECYGFYDLGNWMNILRANSLKGVIAFGMTMVIIAGLIDLSIGSTVALAGVIVARCCRDLTAGGMDLDHGLSSSVLSFPFFWQLWIGWLHGFFSHKAGMPPFIVTLVTLNALYGLAGMISGGFPIANQFPEWFNFLAAAEFPFPPGLWTCSGWPKSMASLSRRLSCSFHS